METDLEQLDTIVVTESRALGFATAFGGIAASTAVAGLTASSPSPMAAAIYVSVSVVTAAMAAWFGGLWRHVRNRRPGVLERIRGRAVEATESIAIEQLAHESKK